MTAGLQRIPRTPHQEHGAVAGAMLMRRWVALSFQRTTRSVQFMATAEARSRYWARSFAGWRELPPCNPTLRTRG